MRRQYAVIALLVVILGLGVYWYEERQIEVQAPKSERAAIPVSVTKVQRKVIPSQIEAIGTLQAKREVDIAPQIAGQVVAVSYTPGTFVKSGKVLIQLDDRIYRAQLTSAQSALKLAEMNYNRTLQLIKSGAASRQMLDQQRATYQQAKALVSQNETYLAQTHITAPFDGYVGAKNVSIGNYVQKGEKLTTVTDRSELRVDYALSERYLPKLKLGQKVEVVVPNQSHIKVEGDVAYISPTINRMTHSVDVHAIIPNKDNLLTPGLFVKIYQVTRINHHALVVPQASIVPTITGPKVFVIKNKKAMLTRIKTGPTFDNMIEVKSGLQNGEVIVVAGQQRLQEGSLVKEVKS